jgi:NAD(P)-dependent dehydrogenase (short-subunit alcohol dehydrogenase family)
VPGDERTVIVTGATGGLGRQAATDIAAAGKQWQVVLAARDVRRAERVSTEIAAATGNHDVAAAELDLASLGSVRRFAAEHIAGSHPPISAIVCNAGIQITSGTTFTEDGIETTFQVNHLGHFLLASLLRGSLAPSGRVIFVSSGTHDPDKATGMPAPRFTSAEGLAHPAPDAADRAAVEGRRRYTTAKLCNVLCTYELARRLDGGATATAFDPGLMPGTGLARDYSRVQRLVWQYALPVLTPFVPGVNTTARSGRNLSRLAIDPKLDGITGAYFSGDRPTGSSTESYDRRKATELWEASERLVA